MPHSHRREGLHLWEHDSTVWVHFCLLRVCNVVADLCIEFMQMSVSGGRGAESVSFDDVSFGDFSEVRNHVTDFNLGMWCFAEEFRGFCGTGANP